MSNLNQEEILKLIKKFKDGNLGNEEKLQLLKEIKNYFEILPHIIRCGIPL